MSILLHHLKTAPEARPVLGWAVADEGLWAADNDGAFAGTIDRQREHFFVRNGFGEYLGDYRTLGAAQSALSDQVHRSQVGRTC